MAYLVRAACLGLLLSAVSIESARLAFQDPADAATARNAEAEAGKTEVAAVTPKDANAEAATDFAKAAASEKARSAVAETLVEENIVEALVEENIGYHPRPNRKSQAPEFDWTNLVENELKQVADATLELLSQKSLVEACGTQKIISDAAREWLEKHSADYRWKRKNCEHVFSLEWALISHRINLRLYCKKVPEFPMC